jgi:hypothetical protein
MPKDAREYHVQKGMEEAAAMRQWLPLVTAAMELPATELFLKLCRGEIEALGKLLPAGVEIINFLEDQNSYTRATSATWLTMSFRTTFGRCRELTGSQML